MRQVNTVCQSINQSINGKITHVGPHQKPDLSCMNWSHKFHYFRIMKKFIIAYVKSREKLLVFRDPVISSIHIRSDRQLILDPVAFYCN